MHQLVPELCNFVTDHFTLNAFYTKLIQSLRTTHHGGSGWSAGSLIYALIPGQQKLKDTATR
ncbi:uncharacterized protein BDCG_06299 [Blastomyces dermatitidis ER-3]|uniref:Uncharacterized protein n=2 Tax=Blastomyces TaxID=229219 RepID=A0A179U8Q3_BLAGS|nr:uncharacterized protein BDBG_16185 [Blastomyces gilchristii SLH14081]XP_045277760.1 uncharacterized protein BDCG_06299 [Blastomyces dermatitidis ER-3]EEQ91178.1 hypothetical protein BDCG_06299 [Blastomyces dermatitidis ER-3]EQL30615.1 hypothetical protein BDFG_06883 [Blastomyces dermatitidis ATCC 26199]OAT04103.1 hypothetical protein BDBG_16185 [Blastomyces gilchristii SLH14081]